MKHGACVTLCSPFITKIALFKKKANVRESDMIMNEL